MIVQLPLEFKSLDTATFASFFAGDSNQEVIAALKEFIINSSSSELFIYLYGDGKVGKTHLLQSVCNYALENNIQAMYVSCENLLTTDLVAQNEIFIGLENIPILCLDDIDLIANNNFLEEKCFFLFNNLRAKKHKLITAANVVPNNLTIKLPDLKSRMSWGITYVINQLSEAEKIAALTMKASQIGLDLNERITKFLLSRINRDPGQLFGALEILDRAALAAKRKLTIPFVKSVLGI